MDILFRNAQIVTQNKNRDILQGDIWIEGNIIKKVAPNIPNPGIQELDLSGQTVIPGLIQTHVHLCQALFRNLADDLELLDWLKHYIWPMEMTHTPRSLGASTRLALHELMTSGVTTILDMGCANHMDVVFEELDASGIRAFSGKVMMDYGDQSYKESTGEVISSSRALIKRWHGVKNKRIHYALAPRFVLTCSNELWSAVGEMSREFDLLIHTHSSENRAELEIVKKQTGYSNVTFFIKHNLASSKLCLAHCIWLTEEEKEYLAEYQINVLHCPGANLKLGSGFAPIPELLQKGINISLGSDGAPCNNNLDIFMDMRLAALIHKPNYGVTSINAQHILDMATVSGAKTLGMANKIGSIDAGKVADLTILDLNKVHTIPADNIVSQIVYSAQSRDVVHVMVDGNWIVWDGVPLAYQNREAIVREAEEECAALIKRLKQSSLNTR